MVTPLFKSYEAMLDYYYWKPLKDSGFDVKVLQKASKISELDEVIDGFEIRKENAPVITSTTGIRNILYGATLNSQVVTEANAFSILPKKPWKSGYRAITAAGLTTGGDVTETGAVPDTLKPTFATVDVTPHRIQRSTNISETEMLLEGKDDTVKWSDIINYTASEFKNTLNRNILANADGAATDGTIITPLDRIIGSYDEVADTELTTDEGDVYGIDRDTEAVWTDAQVSHGGVSGTETDRTLTLGLIDDVIAACEPY